MSQPALKALVALSLLAALAAPPAWAQTDAEQQQMQYEQQQRDYWAAQQAQRDAEQHQQELNRQNEAASHSAFSDAPAPAPSYAAPDQSGADSGFHASGPAPVSRSAGPAHAGGAGSARAAAQAAAPREGLIRIRAGTSAGGSFTPLGGAHIWIVAGDPVRDLIAAGIQPMGSSLAQITYDCQVAWVCVRDFKAITARALGAYATDAAGHARVGPVAPGRYFLIGYATIKGGTMVWSEPIAVQGGDNTVTLDQTDGSAVTSLK